MLNWNIQRDVGGSNEKPAIKGYEYFLEQHTGNKND